MKKKFFVIGTVLAMLVIMVFPCYGEPLKDENGCYKACYQKNNGQLRLLTVQGDECRKNAEVSFPLCLGGPVPKICAGYVDGENCSTDPDNCFDSSCISNVKYLELGQYNITFTTGFDYPICVFYMYPIVGNLIFTEYIYTPGTPTEIIVKVTWLDGQYLDIPFNFICTESTEP